MFHRRQKVNYLHREFKIYKQRNSPNSHFDTIGRVMTFTTHSAQKDSLTQHNWYWSAILSGD